MEASVLERYPCAICVEEFSEEEVVKHCDGKHIFCRECFKQWTGKELMTNNDLSPAEHYREKNDWFVSQIPDLIYRQVDCPICRNQISFRLKSGEIAIGTGAGAEGGFDAFTGTIQTTIPNHGGDCFFQCSYRNGKKHGLYKRRGYYGDITQHTMSGHHSHSGVYNPDVTFECHFENGLLQGPYIIMLDSTTLYVIPYKDGKMDGVLYKWYPGGNQLKEITTYVMGWREGPFKTYHPNGSIYQDGIAYNGLNVSMDLWWKNGNRRAQLIFNKVGEPDKAIYHTWYKNGNPQEISFYLNRKKYGVHQMFDIDGNCILEKDYGDPLTPEWQASPAQSKEMKTIDPEDDDNDQQLPLSTHPIL